MKIHLTVNGKLIAATLADNRIAEDLVAMLPLTIDLHDFSVGKNSGRCRPP